MTNYFNNTPLVKYDLNYEWKYQGGTTKVSVWAPDLLRAQVKAVEILSEFVDPNDIRMESWNLANLNGNLN